MYPPKLLTSSLPSCTWSKPNCAWSKYIASIFPHSSSLKQKARLPRPRSVVHSIEHNNVLTNSIKCPLPSIDHLQTATESLIPMLMQPPLTPSSPKPSPLMSPSPTTQTGTTSTSSPDTLAITCTQEHCTMCVFNLPPPQCTYLSCHTIVFTHKYCPHPIPVSPPVLYPKNVSAGQYLRFLMSIIENRPFSHKPTTKEMKPKPLSRRTIQPVPQIVFVIQTQSVECFGIELCLKIQLCFVCPLSWNNLSLNNF